MSTLIEHLTKLTDHRDRSHLELTLARALIALLPIDRVVIARVLSVEGTQRWLEVASLDARGGKVADPLRVDFAALVALEAAVDRYRCLQTRESLEVAWAGEDGPRITYLPLFTELHGDDDGVIEIHSGFALSPEQQQSVTALRRVFCNMYRLLAYSNRDALTGLLNRKSLDDTFYSAVLDEMDEGAHSQARAHHAPVPGQERRNRVPPNYWFGTVIVDGFASIKDRSGHLAAEEVLMLTARITNNTFRTYDRIYRFHGEQFAVLMHCPEESLVTAAFERLRVNMEKFNFPQVGRVTVSGGFTRITADDSPVIALARAESATKWAQSQGGNQIYSYGVLLSGGILLPEAGADVL